MKNMNLIMENWRKFLKEEYTLNKQQAQELGSFNMNIDANAKNLIATIQRNLSKLNLPLFSAKQINVGLVDNAMDAAEKAYPNTAVPNELEEALKSLYEYIRDTFARNKGIIK